MNKNINLIWTIILTVGLLGNHSYALSEKANSESPSRTDRNLEPSNNPFGKSYLKNPSSVITIKDGFVFSGTNKILNADPETFEQINDFYAKDKNHVYHHFSLKFTGDEFKYGTTSPSVNERSNRTWKISNTDDTFWEIIYLADPETFQIHPEDYTYSYDKDYLYKDGLLMAKTDGHSLKILNQDYTKTNDTVFYKNLVLPQIDTSSFEVFEKNRYITKDKNHVYHNNIVQEVIKDPLSFTVLSSDYGKDNHNFYKLAEWDTPKTEIESNKHTTNFEIINSKKEIFRDGDFLYLGRNKLEGVDPNTFQIFTEKSSYAKDLANVFWINSDSIHKMNNIDLDSFTINDKNPNWAQDKNHVFFAGEIIDNLDPQSFIVLNESYAKDAHVVYLFHLGNIKQILLADSESFSVIEKDSYLSKDNKNVYFWWNLIEQADPNTFVPYIRNDGSSLSSRFAIDKNNAYFRRNAMFYGILTGVDLETFKVMNSGHGAEDKNNFYSSSGHATPKIPINKLDEQEIESPNNTVNDTKTYNNNDNPTSETERWVIDHYCLENAYAYHGYLKENGPLCNSRYERDANNLYYMDKILENADPDSFVFLNYLYFKDKDHAFYEKQLINDSDAESFKTFEYFIKYPEVNKDRDSSDSSYSKLHRKKESYSQVSKYSKDKNNVYFETLKITNADPINFELINDYFGKDNKQVYFENKPIKDADTKTFIALEDKYSRDKNQLFFEDKKVADLSTFDNATDYQRDHYRHYDDNFLLNREYQDGLKVYYRLPYINTGSHVLYNGEKIQDIDTKTFYPLRINTQPSYNQGNLSSYYNRDKNYVYYKTERLEGADPNSFIVIEDKSHRVNDSKKAPKGQDKFGCYEEANKIEC